MLDVVDEFVLDDRLNEKVLVLDVTGGILKGGTPTGGTLAPPRDAPGYCGEK